MSTGEPRLLFVVSNDYGELSNALDLVRGQPFGASLLLPPRLAGSNASGLPVPSAGYRSVADVFEAVDRDRPDVVFLFSGYLFGVNQLFRVEETADLVRGLEARGVAVATSDPFLGLMARPNAATLAPGHPLGPVLVEHFGGLSPSLAGLVHVYFMPAEGVPVARKVWASNPHAFEGGPGIDDRWLYLLSEEDYGQQVGAMGKVAFDSALLALLKGASREGRRPVVLGPSACVEALARSATGVEGVELRTFLGHADFRELLLGAGRVFYWNVFSNSILARVATGRPVSFFAPGHMAHAIPPLFEAGLRHYYSGGPPPLLDALAAPSVRSLEASDDAWRPAREVAIASYREMGGPREMVAEILAHRAELP
jgi:hypothetical protein